MRYATVSKGGQVSIPAEVRHRWHTNRLFMDDRGSELVLRPVPDDPLAAVRGSLSRRSGAPGTTSNDARARLREEEAEARHDPPRNGALTVFDAQALIALMLDEPAAGAVEAELRDPTRASRISAINLAEIVDVMTRIFEQPQDDVRSALELLQAGGLEVVPIDGDVGIEAGRLHARFYDRRTSPLSMADCVALASAMSLGEPLATADPPLAAAARAVGVVVLPLPDARGRSPAA
jgi:uncharacterized protein with PIN domain/bifunctional DNA-binding transcriptional regulator/antitoxin component of YhaV-PrlF toxin-antitoxin module